MKKILVLYLAMFSFKTYAQQTYNGLWAGKIVGAVEIQMAFRISTEADSLTATLDVPDQGIKNLKVRSVSLLNDSIKIEIAQFNAFYIGRMVNDSTINGTLHQQVALPLQLKKVAKLTATVRPQTPLPPFAYKSEDISYKNADNSITFGATITVPNGKGPFPAVMLLTGSGLQNRDEEIVGHKPFAVIADHLTKNGFIVLRADDRTMGTTTGSVESATSLDFARDAIAGFNYLRSRKEVDNKRMGFAGHSEGAMIAQLVASERSDVSFIISLAGPGEKTIDLMSEQNRAMFSKAGLSKDYIEKYMILYDSMLRIIVNYDKNSFESKASLLLDNWIETTPKNIVVVTTGIKDAASKQQFLGAMLATANNDWFRYFVRYNPEENLRNFKGHYLALNGDRDIQVGSQNNLRAIEQALQNGKAKSFEVHELKGLNHLFQECRSCTTIEYGQLDQTVSPEVLDLIAAWLKKTVLIK